MTKDTDYGDSSYWAEFEHWSNAGQGIRRQWEGVSKIQDLLVLPDGQIIFGADVSAFGEGERRCYQAMVQLVNLKTKRKLQPLAIQRQFPPVVTLSFPEDGTIFFSPKRPTT